MAFEKKLSIDDYLNGSQLNSKLYQTLLFLQDNDENGRNVSLRNRGLTTLFPV